MSTRIAIRPAPRVCLAPNASSPSTPFGALTCSGSWGATGWQGRSANGGRLRSLEELVNQFEHVDWEGFHFYDLIFPLFLFVVGVVLPFSLRKYHQGEHPKAAALLRISRRVVLLFLLGLIGNGLLQFEFEHLRVTGVLQRIAICYGRRGDVPFHDRSHAGDPRGNDLAGLLGNSLVRPGPGRTAGDLSKQHNFGGFIDRNYLPGEMKQAYYGYGDNEGLLSTLPAVTTALWACWPASCCSSSFSAWSKVAVLFAAGAACFAAGTFWA